MKGFVKVIIAGAVILGIGIAVLIIALGLNGWTFAPSFTTEEYTATEVNTSLDVTVKAGKLKIEYLDEGENIQVSYPVAKGFETTVTEKDGKLSIDSNEHRWYVFTWGVTFPETVVKIPKDKITEVAITLKAGAVGMKDGTFEKVALNVHAGACAVQNIECDLLTIDLNAGALSLDGVKVETKLTCDVSAGALEINSIDCPETEIDVSAGAATLSFVGAKSDYTATVDVSAGGCKGLSTQSGGDKNIKVKVSAGGCEVKFLG